jgi:hypothetical protein
MRLISMTGKTLAALTLATALVTAGCGGGTTADAAKDVGKGYIEAAKTGDVQKAKSYYAKPIIAALDTPDGFRGLGAIIETVDEIYGKGKIDGAPAEDGDPEYLGGKDGMKQVGELKMRVNYKDGDKKSFKTVTFKMIAEDGGWKLLNVNVGAPQDRQ